MSEEKKQKLKEYQKNIVRLKKYQKSHHNFLLFVFFFSLYKK